MVRKRGCGEEERAWREGEGVVRRRGCGEEERAW